MPNTVPATAIAPNLLAAYSQTEYRVLAPQTFVLHVGQVEPELLRWMQENACRCAAFVTACNPYSQVLADDENAQRQQHLAQEIAQRGLRFVDALGCPRDGMWKPEPSYLVAGLSLEETRQLGRRFEQNAVLWSGSDARVQLVLLR